MGNKGTVFEGNEGTGNEGTECTAIWLGGYWFSLLSLLLQSNEFKASGC